MVKQGACWITWNASVRSRNLARALDVQLHEICLSSGIIRHLVSAAHTACILYRTRPHIVYIQYSFLLLIVLCAYKAMVRKRIVVICDCHTKALRRGVSGPFKKLFWAVKARSFAFVDISLIHNAGVVADIGRLHPCHYVLPDPLPETEQRRMGSPAMCRCVYSSSFAVDEPKAEIFELAASLDPNVQILWTGRPPDDFFVPENKPRNLIFTGYLAYDDYMKLILEADVVLAMTSEEGCLQCAGFEALATGTPLVVSDTRALREYFGGAAVYTKHRPKDMARAVRYAIGNRTRLSRRLATLRSKRVKEFKGLLLALRHEVEMRSTSPLTWMCQRISDEANPVREASAKIVSAARRYD